MQAEVRVSAALVRAPGTSERSTTIKNRAKEEVRMFRRGISRAQEWKGSGGGGRASTRTGTRAGVAEYGLLQQRLPRTREPLL